MDVCSMLVTLPLVLAEPAQIGGGAQVQARGKAPPVAFDLTSKIAQFTEGDLHGFALNDAGTRGYLGEGATVKWLDVEDWIAGDDAVIAKAPLGASIVAMAVDDDADQDAEDDLLYVAGGTFGLIKLDLTPITPPLLPHYPVYRQVTIDDYADPASSKQPNEKWCFDVERLVAGDGVERLVALFGQAGASELRVYDLASVRAAGGPVEPELVIALPSGADGDAFSYAIAVRGAQAYVALGSGGLTRIDLTDPAVPLEESGPLFDRNAPQSSCAAPCGGAYYEPYGRVRDVAIAGDFLEAAVDDWGLVELDLTDPWSETMAVECVAVTATLTGGTCGVGFAHQVAATIDGVGKRRVVVGTNNEPVLLQEAAPYVFYGRMGWELSPGGEPAAVAAQPGVDALFAFEAASGAELAPANGSPVVTKAQRWRELVLGADLRVFEQRIVWPVNNGLPTRPAGLLLRNFGSAAEVCRYAGEGKSAFGGTFSKVDPDVLLLSQEGPSGSDNAGFLEIDQRRVVAIDGTADLNVNHLGIVPFDAHWSALGAEFFLQGYRFGWMLRYFDALDPTKVSWWQVPAPPEPADACSQPAGCPLKGELYFGSEIDPRAVASPPSSELLVLTRGFTRYGGLLYDRATLVAAAQTKWSTACDCQRCRTCIATDASTCFELPAVPGAPPNPQCAITPAPLDADNDCALITVTNCAVAVPGGYAGLQHLLDTHPEMANFCGDDDDGNGVIDCREKKKYYRNVRTWRSRVGEIAASGTFVAAFAAGHNGDRNAADFERAMLVLYDVTACTAAPFPPPLGPWVFHAPDYVDAGGTTRSFGEAVAVDLATLDSRTYAFVADFGGRVFAVDVTDPAAMRFAGQWIAPFATFDGRHETVGDLLVDESDPAGPFVYVAAFRMGLVRLPISIDANDDVVFAAPKVVDTPGLAHGLRIREKRYGASNQWVKRLLLVGDKGGGISLYGQL